MIAVLGISQLTGLRENLRVQQVMVLTPKYEVLCNFPHPILRMFHHDRIPKKSETTPNPNEAGYLGFNAPMMRMYEQWRNMWLNPLMKNHLPHYNCHFKGYNLI